MPLPPLRSVLGAAVLACATVSPALADTELFNGRDLSGWSIQNDGQFAVEDGLLTINRGTGWLRSDRTYGDYTLELEVRFNEARANSGIFVRTGPTSHDDENGWPNNGYQVQCMDISEGAHPIGTLIEYGAGGFEQVFNPMLIAEALNPPGEWNTIRITCEGGTIAVRLNGSLITLVQGVAKSSGHIGLQGEKGLLQFRRIALVD